MPPFKFFAELRRRFDLFRCVLQQFSHVSVMKKFSFAKNSPCYRPMKGFLKSGESYFCRSPELRCSPKRVSLKGFLKKNQGFFPPLSQ